MHTESRWEIDTGHRRPVAEPRGTAPFTLHHRPKEQCRPPWGFPLTLAPPAPHACVEYRLTPGLDSSFPTTVSPDRWWSDAHWQHFLDQILCLIQSPHQCSLKGLEIEPGPVAERGNNSPVLAMGFPEKWSAPWRQYGWSSSASQTASTRTMLTGAQQGLVSRQG